MRSSEHFKASTASKGLIARNDLFLVHVVQLKPTIKDQISGKLASNGISDVAIASVNSEKTLTKKMIMIIIIISMNKSQELTVFYGRQKLTSAKN